MGIFDSKLQFKISEAKVVDVDVSLSESHNETSRITKHPIEDGSTISDHIIKDPFTVTITGFISNTPLGLKGLKDKANKIVKTPANLKKLVSGKSVLDTMQTAYNDLVFLRDSDKPIEVITGLKSYTDMYIQKLSINRTPQTTGGLPFSITLQQIKKVKSKESSSTSVGRTEGINAKLPTAEGSKQKVTKVPTSIARGLAKTAGVVN